RGRGPRTVHQPGHLRVELPGGGHRGGLGGIQTPPASAPALSLAKLHLPRFAHPGTDEDNIYSGGLPDEAGSMSKLEQLVDSLAEEASGSPSCNEPSVVSLIGSTT